MATWRDDIVHALNSLGGSAALADIYAEVRRIRPLPHPQSFEEVIRRTIEQASSDTQSYTGPDLFRSINGVGGGVWGLRSRDRNARERVRTESGMTLDAEFSVAPESDGFAIVIESRGGGHGSAAKRHPDYQDSMRFLLSRLAAAGATLADATVESRETAALPHQEKVLEIAPPFPVSLASEDPEEIRLRLGRAQALIGRARGAPRGGNSTKRIRLFVRFPGSGWTVGRARELLAYGTSDIAMDEVANIEAIVDPQKGQRYASDVRTKIAVERRAMDLAKAWLSDDGWTVRDVSKSRSYDLHCAKQGQELRVEVKGTRGGGDTILITRNELNHARDHANVHLAIVSRIVIDRDSKGAPSASGGVLRWYQPWVIKDSDLEAIAFEWTSARSALATTRTRAVRSR